MQEAGARHLPAEHGAVVGLPGGRRPSVQRVRLHAQPQARRSAAVPGQTTRVTCTPMPSAATTACICRTRARRRPASSRWPAMRTRGASSTRRGAADAVRSHRALAYYGQLYELERRCQGLYGRATAANASGPGGADPEAVPRVAGAQQREVLPKSPMAEAIGYALNNWTALIALYGGGLFGHRQQRGRTRDEADRHRPQELVDSSVRRRRPDGGGAVQLHVHVPAAGRRAVGVPAGRADALAGAAGWATRALLPDHWQPTRAGAQPGGDDRLTRCCVPTGTDPSPP